MAEYRLPQFGAAPWRLRLVAAGIAKLVGADGGTTTNATCGPSWFVTSPDCCDRHLVLGFAQPRLVRLKSTTSAVFTRVQRCSGPNRTCVRVRTPRVSVGVGRYRCVAGATDRLRGTESTATTDEIVDSRVLTTCRVGIAHARGVTRPGALCVAALPYWAVVSRNVKYLHAIRSRCLTTALPFFVALCLRTIPVWRGENGVVPIGVVMRATVRWTPGDPG